MAANLDMYVLPRRRGCFSESLVLIYARRILLEARKLWQLTCRYNARIGILMLFYYLRNNSGKNLQLGPPVIVGHLLRGQGP